MHLCVVVRVDLGRCRSVPDAVLVGIDHVGARVEVREREAPSTARDGRLDRVVMSIDDLHVRAGDGVPVDIEHDPRHGSRARTNQRS